MKLLKKTNQFFLELKTWQIILIWLIGLYIIISINNNQNSLFNLFINIIQIFIILSLIFFTYKRKVFNRNSFKQSVGNKNYKAFVSKKKKNTSIGIISIFFSIIIYVAKIIIIFVFVEDDRMLRDTNILSTTALILFVYGLYKIFFNKKSFSKENKNVEQN
jgi:hypothetical protein